MQRVESADAESRTVLFRQIDAGIPGAIGEVHCDPNSLLPIPFKITPGQLRFSKRESQLNHLLKNRIGKLHTVEWRLQDRRRRSHSSIDAPRMCINNVTGNQKAGVDVCVQYRLFSRSSIKSATGVSTRSPKIARLRAAKSGHSTGCGRGDSGTILATTRLRLRSSTTPPASSHLMSWRVSRS